MISTQFVQEIDFCADRETIAARKLKNNSKLTVNKTEKHFATGKSSFFGAVIYRFL
jgi:hypothetical protein